MLKLLLLTIFLGLCLVHSSLIFDSNDSILEDSSTKSVVLSPIVLRQRSFNCHSLSFIHHIPNSQFSKSFLSPVRQNSILDLSRDSITRITHPRSSLILRQLEVIDDLMSTQFHLQDSPVRIMNGHLDALKEICGRFLNIYGPLHPFYRNCAFRRLELESFLTILTKYNTQVDVSVMSKCFRTRESFCKKLGLNLKKLNSLISAAINEFSPQLLFPETDVKFIKSVLGPVVAVELGELEGVVDGVDWNLSEFCEAGSMTNETIQLVKLSINNFLKLAFI